MKKLKVLALSFLLLFSVIATSGLAKADTPQIVNVQSYGATGNDQSDDTKAIQNAINDATKTSKTASIPAGNYYINPDVGLNLPSNTTLNFENGAKIITLPSAKDSYSIIKIWGVSNVKIAGNPTIIGERDKHKGTSGEWGMGIDIKSSNSVYVENANISNCWGDGIYVGVLKGSQSYNKDITLKNVNLDSNRRQGISVISAINLMIDNPTITNTNGTPPAAGIDFEPNSQNEYLQNITVNNPNIQYNTGHGIQFYFGLGPFQNPVSISINNAANVKNNKNIPYGDSKKDIWLSNDSLSKVKGKITVDGKDLFNSDPAPTPDPSTPSVSDLQKQIDTLKAENAKLTSDNTSLQSQVKKVTDENNVLTSKLNNIQNILNN